MTIIHYILSYGVVVPMGVTLTLVFIVSLFWIVFISGKLKNSYRLWVYYKQYYKYSEEYSQSIVFHRNTYIKNILILLFLCVDVLFFFFLAADGLVSVIEYKYLPHNGNISTTCRIESATWLSVKFSPSHPEVSMLESIWQVLCVVEMTVLNILYLFLIQTYSHQTAKNEKLINLFVVYIPIEVATIFVFNIFRATVLLGRLVFIVLVQLHMALNIHYSRLLWQRLKRHKIDMTYFLSQESREFTVFDKVITRYKWLTIANCFFLEMTVLVQILFTVVNVFVATVLLNPCWLESVYGIEIPRFEGNIHALRLVTYLVICVRDWVITAYLLYILVVQMGIVLTHVLTRCLSRKAKVSGFVQVTTPLSDGQRGMFS